MPCFLFRINQIFIFTQLFLACIPVPVADAATSSSKPFLVSAQGECKLASKDWISECDNYLEESLKNNAQKLCPKQENVIIVKVVKKRACVPKGQLHSCEIKALFQCK